MIQFLSNLAKSLSRPEEEQEEYATIPRTHKDRAIDWDEFVGNEDIVERLRMEVEAHRITGEPLPNILLYGNPGMGKTTLAKIVASKVNAKLVEITGSSINSQLDLVRMMCQINEEIIDYGTYHIVFIDEIHGITKGRGLSEDIWLPLLEDGYLYHSCNGKELPGTTKEVCLDYVPVCGTTFIGATTDPGMLTEAMRRRFQITAVLKPYTLDNIKQIISVYAQKQGYEITDEAVNILADRSRGSPAMAIHHLLRQAIRCEIVKNEGLVLTIGEESAKMACRMAGIREGGVMDDDITIMKVLASVYPKGMGIKTIAGTANLSKSTVEEIALPFLQHRGWVVTTHKRFLTEEGMKKVKELESREI